MRLVRRCFTKDGQQGLTSCLNMLKWPGNVLPQRLNIGLSADRFIARSISLILTRR